MAIKVLFIKRARRIIGEVAFKLLQTQEKLFIQFFAKPIKKRD
jgi:hypothetical protein